MITSIKAPLSIIKYKLISKKKRIKPDIREVTHYEKNIIRELKEKGHVIVPNYISKKECNEIISKIDFCIENYKKNIWNDENFSDQRIFGSEIISKQIEKYHYDKQLHKIGEEYAGYKMKNLKTMANKVSYKDLNKGSGGGWHKDAYYNQFKSILYLNDTFDENGPFELIENSNKILNTLDISFKLSKGYPNTRFTDYEIQKLNSKKLKKLQDLQVL